MLAPVAMQLMLSCMAAAEEFTGYVVDNYCWDRPGHVGLDGSQLGTAPGTHILHCVWQVPQCMENGYVLLEELSTADADGYTYAPKHQLDDVGDALIIEMCKAEQDRGGDYAFDVQVTITGTLVDDEIAVSRVCITPSVSNDAGEVFCHDAPDLEIAATTEPPTADTFTGYVVDNYCWGQPGHVGLDGSQLGTVPGTHTLHCMFDIPQCMENGYVLLEELSAADADGYTYTQKYRLDAVGDALIVEMGQAEQDRVGDYAFDVQVTITGTVADDEIAVSRVCITPLVSNDAGETFCHTADSMASASSSLRAAASAGALALWSVVELACA